MRYVMLLRGINVGGHGLVSMAALQAVFSGAGFGDVVTYLNSGNVVFSSDLAPRDVLPRVTKVLAQWGVAGVVLTGDELASAVAQAPDWWDADPQLRHNAIFALPPATPPVVAEDVLARLPESERVALVGPVIFWTTTADDVGRARLAQVVRPGLRSSITVRNAKTTRSLARLGAAEPIVPNGIASTASSQALGVPGSCHKLR